jgi:hypothetical protein
MRKYIVIADGSKVYDGTNEFEACQKFDEYEIRAKNKESSFFNKNVKLHLGDGRLLKENNL